MNGQPQESGTGTGRDARTGHAPSAVAHRITNVAVADRIVVLDEGRIVQEGTYQELSRQPGQFRELLSYQVTSETARSDHGQPGAHP